MPPTDSAQGADPTDPTDPTRAVDSVTPSDPATLAESIRRAVLTAGEAAYEDAGIRGLCAEGRWEAAVSAMRAVDLEDIVRRATAKDHPRQSATPGTGPSGV